METEYEIRFGDDSKWIGPYEKSVVISRAFDLADSKYGNAQIRNWDTGERVATIREMKLILHGQELQDA